MPKNDTPDAPAVEEPEAVEDQPAVEAAPAVAPAAEPAADPAPAGDGARQDFAVGDDVPDYARGASAFTHIDGVTYDAENDMVTAVHPRP